ncbi:MAG: sulfotransferase, partial [Anaerolineales bacterium]|nr:sulfotransferase [Anaerolineales bacterium]
NQPTNQPAKPTRTVISQETLSGRGDGSPIWDPHRIAKRLYMTFPNAKILIVIRNQFDYILSLYAFRVVRRGLEYRSLDEFLTLKQDQLRVKLQYDRLIGDYVRLFGKDRILVLPYEAMAADAAAFVQNVLDFFDCGQQPVQLSPQRENVSTRNGRYLQTSRLINAPFAHAADLLLQKKIISQKKYTYLATRYFGVKKRLINPLLERQLDPSSPPLDIPLTWKSQLAPIFQSSNRRLTSLVDFNLQQYRYPW